MFLQTRAYARIWDARPQLNSGNVGLRSNGLLAVESRK